MPERIIQTQRLYSLLDWEVYSLLFILIVSAYLFYLIFLPEVSEERHKNVQNHFRNIVRHFFLLSGLFFAFLFLEQMQGQSVWIEKSLPYVGLATLIWGMVVFVKTIRLSILQYLFLGSMRAGVPVLIVNIVSLSVSIGFALWTANHIFRIELGPLVATSAAFSIILGLALQDTLGNLFAGISFQLDKTFEIGDWLEVTQGVNRIQGQVKEISWRGTLLIGWNDEKITIPNRVLASSLISNFTLDNQPILRVQKFTIDAKYSKALIKKTLESATRKVADVKPWPEPFVLISDANQAGVTYKLCYYIDNFGSQNTVLTHVLDECLEALHQQKIEVASQKVEVFGALQIPPTQIL